MRLAIRVGNLPPYIALSLAGHLSVVLAMALLAGLNSSGKALEPSIRVDLVGASALDGAPTPAAAAAPPEPVEDTPLPTPPAPDPEPEPDPAAADVRPMDETEEPEEQEEPIEQPPPRPKPQPREDPPPNPTPTETPTESNASGGGAVGPAAEETGLGEFEGIAEEFTWYRLQLIGALRRAWRQPTIPGLRDPLEVEVRFELLRNGAISNPQLTGPSGVSSMDRSVFRALVEASLPPMPPAMDGNVKKIRTVFVLYPEDGR